MTTYYSNSQQYHDDLDAFEARVRAMEAEEALEAKLTPKPDAKRLVEIYEEEYAKTHDFKKAAEAVEQALGDDSTAWDKERNDLRTMGQGG